MLRNNVSNLLIQGAVFTTPLPKLDDPLCHENIAIKPDWFFPRPHGFSGANREARELCKRCPEIEPCLEYALENNIQSGIWGGTLPKDRILIRRKRRNG